jgi:transcriptional regulator with XRE-family HTH domain
MSTPRRNEREQRFDFAVGRRIRQERKRRGVSGVLLARALGMLSSHLYWIESGGRCSFSVAVEIARTLGVELADLVPDLVPDFIRIENRLSTCDQSCALAKAPQEEGSYEHN